MLQLDDVSYTYRTGHGSVAALQGVSLDVSPGETVVVLGANGSGKSTLARLTNGLLVPDEGTVRVDGLDTDDEAAMWEVRTRVGLVFQNPDNQIVGTVVEEDVAFGPENLGVERAEIRRRVDSSLATVGLTGFERREPHLLSGGQKQRLAIAGALAMQPTYLVMDEPTSMLDPEGRADVLAVARRLCSEGHGVLHITHDLSDIASADRVIVLARGAVVFAGSPEGLLEEPGHLARWGLAVPPVALLAQRLRELGLPVPLAALDAESVVGALWPSS